MGSMAASDAAPLPRLGEVFFDVRGSSRSMRLSWYADTGIAVFSIWQGGTCTGTFRLPMDDLSRLMDSLRRGMPGGQDDFQEPSQAIEGPRGRLAIGAAPEPYTGALVALGATPLASPAVAEARGARAWRPARVTGTRFIPAMTVTSGATRDRSPPGDPQVTPAPRAYGDQPAYDAQSL